MPRRAAPLFLAFLVLAIPAAAQERIARLKLAPQDYRGRSIELEGEVVEVQALSPRSRTGTYRLVDGSDPAGVLIRTRGLPTSGGPFRVRATLSPELLVRGQLLLDEAERDAARFSWLPVALALAALGLLVLGGASAFYYRARQRERHMRLAPPLWLIPAGGETAHDAQTTPPQRFDYRLQYVEEERSAVLETRKRRARLALIPGGLLVATGAVWAAVAWQAETAQPSFVLMVPEAPAPEEQAAVPVPSDTTTSTTVAPKADDTLRVALLPGVRPPDSVPRRRRPRPDTIAAGAAATPAMPRQVVASPDTSVVKVVTATPTEQAAPAPAPAPPPPPPAEERREPPPVVVDEAAIRRAAEAELQRGIARFMAALSARQVGSIATYYPANGDNRRTKFLDFLRDNEPEASLRATEAATATESSAQAIFTVNFRWRGEFGVARRKDARFAATARRTGDGWAFESARLLEAMP